MFEGLDEQMKRDEQAEISPTEKYLRWAAVAIASIVLFGGLYLGVRMVGG
jgi:hypothetical protein